MAMIKLRTKGSKIVTPEIPGVMCKNAKCGAGIEWTGNLADLGKSFNAKCPTCGRTATYRKSEIKTMQIERM